MDSEEEEALAEEVSADLVEVASVAGEPEEAGKIYLISHIPAALSSLISASVLL